ncbi:MAG TPA: DUF2946 domain-containing protein [Trinickia sp.]|uniref:DUF2946 domain-containing protein n=1 Tax=Trinickia sp. TaxID=2571163 RepID=UPI002BF930EA|nr:DUF2946 domain-containing protein [Trinickia sp.]HTI17451.1 DUF2946 domain-containing protein [Trinickia sp.]
MAMWLVVFAPVISQLVVSVGAEQPVAPLCTVEHAAQASDHQATADSMAACGYCDLLATHTVVASVPPVGLERPMLIAFAATPAFFTSFTPLGAFASGRPRAPPFVS